MKTYKIGQFAHMIHRSVRTVQKWDTSGKLRAHRTITNRRYYTQDQVDEVLRIKPMSHEYRSPLAKSIDKIQLKYFTGKNLITKLGEAEMICTELHREHNYDYDSIAKLLKLPVAKVKAYDYRGQPLRYSNFFFMLPGSYMLNDIHNNMKYYLKRATDLHMKHIRF